MLLALGLLAAGCGSSAEDAEREQGSGGLSENGDDQSALQEPARSDWPQFLGPFGKSVSAEKGIIAPWPDRGLQVIWQKPIGEGCGMPAISQGRLFQFDRHGDQARLSCLRSETGEFLWNFEYPTDYHDQYGFNNGPRCCPVVDGDRVYIYGAEGMLHCVRGTDGQVLWKVDTRADFHVVPNDFGVGSAPVIEGDLLIVQIGGSQESADPDAPLKGNGSGVVAFDKLTGKVRYQISDELASYSSPVLATIHGRRWCFVLARGGLIGFEPASGQVDFHFPWRARAYQSQNASNPVVVNDRVFISECYGPGSALLEVKPGRQEPTNYTGGRQSINMPIAQGGYDVLWTADKRSDKSMQCHWNTPIYHNGYLYGCSGRHTNEAELRCIQLSSGKVMWRQPNLTLSSLLMVDGHFICLTEYGKLLLLKVNPHSYEKISRMDLFAGDEPETLLQPPCWAAPILSHGRLYVRGNDKLVCLELILQKK
jgi:outer membrane protein assembly factor BamB